MSQKVLRQELSFRWTILRNLCQTFESGPPNSEHGCLAMKHIDEKKEDLGRQLSEQLYEFRATLDTDDSLASYVEQFGIIPMVRVGFTLWPNEFNTYLKRQARLLTEKRIKITPSSFYREVFGIPPALHGRSQGPKYFTINSKIFIRDIYKTIEDEEKRQRVVLPQSNGSAMRMDVDKWKVHYVLTEGTSLLTAEYDFTVIKNKMFKHAFMYWLIQKRWHNKVTSFKSESYIGMIAKAFNFLSENVGATMPSDVTITHVRMLVQYLCNEAKSYKGKPLSLSSIRDHFKILNQMFDWLARTDVSIPDGQPRVLMNAFRAVSFKNEDEHTTSAEYMPEEVVAQLLLHRFELPPEVNRCLTIMMELGLRFSDTMMIEAGSLSYDEDLEMHVLRYVPQKTKHHRLKRGLDVYHEVGIKNFDVVLAILEQEQASAALRAQTGMKHIFLKKNWDLASKVNILSHTGFTNPVRALILKHNITDHEGTLWKFNSHQCRKTVAVVMVENKSHPFEIRQFLGHLKQRTTDGIYAEVRKLRLGELNHKFFEKKFQAHVSKEQLNSFGEDERRVLYAEFALGYREVELGHCIKHISEGTCGKRSGETHCSTCKNLCTGPQFKLKWVALVESQICVVAELETAYAKANISQLEYCEYREYLKAKKLLTCYNAVLDKITSYRL